jgi:hypothetical protein
MVEKLQGQIEAVKIVWVAKLYMGVLLMFVNTRDSYIEIGTNIGEAVGIDVPLENSLQLPVPIELPSSNEFLVDAERNANATMAIQQIGRTQYTMNINWGNLKNTIWWKINRWFEKHGYVFYMKYFSHTEGRVKIHRFYRGNINKGVPSSVTETINSIVVPQYYSGCGFSIIDMGEETVYTISEIEV